MENELFSSSPELLQMANQGIQPNDFYGFIYITTNMVNGKKYIGQKKFYDGWTHYLGSGHALMPAIKKYGKSCFSREVIELCKNADILNERESFWIDTYNAVLSQDFYNLMPGGNSGDKLTAYTPEQRAAHFKRCADSQRGKPRHYKNGHPMLGHKHTEEAKKKMSENSKGLNSGADNYLSRPVICVTTSEIFDCISQAEKKYNTNNISACCRRERYYAGVSEQGDPLQWAYYDKDTGSYDEPLNPNLRYNGKPVDKLTLDGEYVCTYLSGKIASEETGAPYQKIIAVCTGVRKTSGGFIWRYSDLTPEEVLYGRYI